MSVLSRIRSAAQRSILALLAAGTLAGGLAAGSGTASAEPITELPGFKTARVLASPSLTIRSAPYLWAPAIGSAPYGIQMNIRCYRLGSAVSGPYGTSTVWDQTWVNGRTGYASDAWLWTGSSRPVVPHC